MDSDAVSDHPAMRTERQVELAFSAASVEAQTHVNLSAVRSDGAYLWVAGDETATVERLHADSADTPREYRSQRTFALADLVDLPGERDEEADIEGLGLSAGWLWAIGSHSLVRKKVKPKHDDVKAIKRLGKVRDEPNRHVIARIALEQGDDGPIAVRTSSDGRRSAVLGADPQDSLTRALADDPHLGPFLRIPAKDNGFDVEGIAVHGQRLYVGLRGPVLRGWAVLVEIEPQGAADSEHLVLGDLGGETYRKHFLDLDGLGIRDLCPHGDDLLILAGPSMDLDGPVRVHRWQGAMRTDAPDVARSEDLPVAFEVAYGHGDDHAEGISLIDQEAGPMLLVVYDSPAPHRRPRTDTVLADLVAI